MDRLAAALRTVADQFDDETLTLEALTDYVYTLSTRVEAILAYGAAGARVWDAVDRGNRDSAAATQLHDAARVAGL